MIQLPVPIQLVDILLLVSVPSHENELLLLHFVLLRFSHGRGSGMGGIGEGVAYESRERQSETEVPEDPSIWNMTVEKDQQDEGGGSEHDGDVWKHDFLLTCMNDFQAILYHNLQGKRKCSDTHTNVYEENFLAKEGFFCYKREYKVVQSGEKWVIMFMGW